MPAFRYTAYDREGRQRRGVLDAPSAARAGEVLAGRGLTVVEISEGVEKKRAGKAFNLSYHALFCRGLSSYLKRGVPLAEALKFLSRHSSDKKVAGACLHLHERVNEGMRLSAAMEETGVFREDTVRIVESGERTSALGGVLEQAAALYSMQAGWQRKIRSALTYPLAMTAVGMAVIVFLLTYVVPRLADLFADMGQALPLPTRILLAAASFLRSWWPGLVLAAAVLFFWARRKRRFSAIPFFRRTRENINLALVMSHLQTLLSAGIPLVQALAMASSVDSDPGRWQEAAGLVKEGFRFDRALERLGVFPEEAVYIIGIGELGGDLSGAVAQVAGMNWEEAADRMDRVATLAEPLLVLFLGLAVGFVVIAVLLPIFELSGLAV
ncbi:MAG: type II secretion system F family protein [Aminivibrio sp.]